MEKNSLNYKVLFCKFSTSVNSGALTVPNDGYAYIFVRGVENVSVDVSKLRRIYASLNGVELKKVKEESDWESIEHGEAPLYVYRSNAYQEAYAILKVKKGDQIVAKGMSESDVGYINAYGGAMVVYFGNSTLK